MSEPIGAPGTGVSRREFLAATGTVGAGVLAGCQAPTDQAAEASTQETTPTARQSNLPTTSPPRVVNVAEQGGSVTLKTQPAVHQAHPLESMGGPVELPRV